MFLFVVILVVKDLFLFRGCDFIKKKQKCKQTVKILNLLLVSGQNYRVKNALQRRIVAQSAQRTRKSNR